jgi:hypothetical protein
MKSYSIFVKQNPKNNKVEDVFLIKEGFHWKACVFNIIWLLLNRLWIASLAFLLLYSLVELIFSPFASGVIFCFVCLLLGFEAENILFYRLKKEQCLFMGFSTGIDEDDARIKFLEQINKERKTTKKSTD